MAFCTNCGGQIVEGTKFCGNCGAPTNITQNESMTVRKNIYEGNIYKCPNCGEVLHSFVFSCPACGYELRGAKSSDSVQEFTTRLSQADTEEQKITLLRSFPIPNTKEDIFEFMILAVTNIKGEWLEEQPDKISEAWLAKLEQCYQKALLLFKDDEDFLRIKNIYDAGYQKIKVAKKKAIIKKTLQVTIRNIAVLVGLVLVIIAVIVDRIMSGAPEAWELIGYIVLIVSAYTLTKGGASMIDFGVAAMSGLGVLGLSGLLDNGAMGILCGGIILIIVAVAFFLKKLKIV